MTVSASILASSHISSVCWVDRVGDRRPIPTLRDEETAESNPALAIRLVDDVRVSFGTQECVCHNASEFLRFLREPLLVWNLVLQHMNVSVRRTPPYEG